MVLLGAEADDYWPRPSGAYPNAYDWARTATVAGGRAKVTALDLVSEAVRTGADGLRDVADTLGAVRH